MNPILVLTIGLALGIAAAPVAAADPIDTVECHPKCLDELAGSFIGETPIERIECEPKC